jgi:hypothetical protein
MIDNDTSTLHVRPTLILGTNLLKPPLNPTTYDYGDPDAATAATLVGDLVMMTDRRTAQSHGYCWGQRQINQCVY